MGLNRTLCNVLEEMRKLHETRNYCSLLGLIEEAQSMANRMESKLYDMKDYEWAQKEYKRLSKEIDAMKEAKGN